VNTEDFNESGRVYLELADATPAEAERGMEMLRKLVR
jgi:creatinine amidohydrolase/Fe(II)-dependent formamide hydrolase-like protein